MTAQFQRENLVGHCGDRPQDNGLGAGQGAGQSEPTPWIWLLVLVLGAAALRSIALDQQLWYDEIVAVLSSLRKPLSTILTSYTTQNQHTLYSILARGSILIWGEHPWTLRLPAVVFGVLSVPALHFFGQLVTSRREALLASALMVLSYHPVWFSQNARGYTAMLLWALLSSYFFVRGTREGGWRPWMAYGITMALGMYTHLTMAFVAVGHALTYGWILVRPANHRFSCSMRQPLAGFLLAGSLALALYAPLLPQMLARTVRQSGTSTQSEWKDPLWLIQETVRGLKAGAGGSLSAMILVSLLGLTGLLSYWRKDRYVVGLMLFPAVLTAGVMFALEHNLWPRFFFFSIGFVFLFLVRGAYVWSEVAARRLGRDAHTGLRWGTVLVVLMLAGSALALPAAYRYPKQDLVGAMRFLEAQRKPGEPIVTVGRASFAYQAYYGRAWRAVESRDELEAVRAQNPRTWLVYFFPIDLKSRSPEIWRAIQTEFTTVAVFRGTLGGGEIYVCQAEGKRASEQASR